jgi:hypothetical protein
MRQISPSVHDAAPGVGAELHTAPAERSPAPSDEFENFAQRHRFSGQERGKYPLWPVVLILACFWAALIVGVKSCADSSPPSGGISLEAM